MRVAYTLDSFPEDYHPSDQLNSLLLKALNIGLDRLATGGALLPMLIVDTPRGYELIVIEVDDEMGLLAEAADRLAGTPDAYAYALLFEGEFHSEAGGLSGVVVEGAEPGMSHGYRLLGIAGESAGAVYHGHAAQLFRESA